MIRTFLAGFAAAMTAVTGAAAGDTYILDSQHTHVVFKVNRFGLSNTIGTFRDVTGTLVLDEEDPAKSAVTATINVDSLRSDDDTREGHLKGELWLNAAAFPAITFASTKVEPDGESHAKVTGDLTVHGVTKEVVLNVALVRIGMDPATKRKAAGFSATGKVNRHDFGVSIAEQLIGADVEISIEALGIAPE